MSDSEKSQEASTSMGLEPFLFLKIKSKNVRQLFLDVPFLSAPCPDIVTMCNFLLGSRSLPVGPIPCSTCSSDFNGDGLAAIFRAGAEALPSTGVHRVVWLAVLGLSPN